VNKSHKSFGLLESIPKQALEELRNQTGRHKRDHILEKNLYQIVISLEKRFEMLGEPQSILYSALDANSDGISSALWHHLVALRLETLGNRSIISALGFIADVGQSGRTAGGLKFPDSRDLPATKISRSPH
jgi:hypothetical protein